jgi:thiosulfate reductase cytochrome b subunit
MTVDFSVQNRKKIRTKRTIMSDGKIQDKPFWKSSKLYYVIGVLLVFAVIVVSGVAVFTPEQIIGFLEFVFGSAMGAHTLTNVASFFKKKDDQ